MCSLSSEGPLVWTLDCEACQSRESTCAPIAWEKQSTRGNFQRTTRSHFRIELNALLKELPHALDCTRQGWQCFSNTFHRHKMRNKNHHDMKWTQYQSIQYLLLREGQNMEVFQRPVRTRICPTTIHQIQNLSWDWSFKDPHTAWLAFQNFRRNPKRGPNAIWKIQQITLMAETYLESMQAYRLLNTKDRNHLIVNNKIALVRNHSHLPNLMAPCRFTKTLSLLMSRCKKPAACRAAKASVTRSTT